MSKEEPPKQSDEQVLREDLFSNLAFTASRLLDSEREDESFALSSGEKITAAKAIIVYLNHLVLLWEKE